MKKKERKKRDKDRDKKELERVKKIIITKDRCQDAILV